MKQLNRKVYNRDQGMILSTKHPSKLGRLVKKNYKIREIAFLPAERAKEAGNEVLTEGGLGLS